MDNYCACGSSIPFQEIFAIVAIKACSRKDAIDVFPFCEEYRDSQQLLALKIRLSKDNLDPEEKREIERLIRELEKKLKM